MTTLSVWRYGGVGCVWQTGSQTAVPAESSYHQQGRLSRDEQINYRQCVCNKVSGKKGSKNMRANCWTKIYDDDKLEISNHTPSLH